MTDFLNELQADIQEENLFNLWRQYGKYVIGAMVVVLLATGTYLLWHHHRQAALNHQSVQYQAALEFVKKNRPLEALKVFDALEKTDDGYKILAQLQKTALKAQQILSKEDLQKEKSLEEAFAPLIVGEKKLFPLKNLATAVLSFALLKAGVENTAALKEIESYLTPQNPWKGLALELLILRAFQEKNTVIVREMLDKYLYNRDISQGIQTRLTLEAMGMGIGLSAQENLEN